jgi:DNA repair exonuclease SbcCD ATPase subunit
MRIFMTVAIAALLIGSSIANAADRNKSLAQIETIKAAMDQVKTIVGENKIASSDLDTAAKHLDKASAALKEGEKMFGGISDEAEQEIRHQTSMADLTLKLATSRIERSKIESDLATLSKKTETVKAKVKIFDDLRAEIARLKGEIANNEKAVKELAALNAEKASLAAQVQKLTAETELLDKVKSEKESLQKSFNQLKEENNSLTRQLEKIESTRKSAQPKAFETVPPPKPASLLSPLTEPEQKPLLEEITIQPDAPSGSK